MNFSDPTIWLNIIQGLVVFFLSLTVHEYAHARVAFALGDDTASRQGRLTLNPISHIDFFGTILMPVIGGLTGIPVIGWAKPVPVNPARMSRKMSMRGGMALVAVAGPHEQLHFGAFSACSGSGLSSSRRRGPAGQLSPRRQPTPGILTS